MSNKIYTTIPAPKLPRNTFNRSRPNTLSMPFQRTVPTLLEEIYPGDLFRCNPELFARLQPMIAPVMNNMKISTHFFYVPLRTLNKHFSEFMFNNRTGDYTDVLPYCYTGTIYTLVAALSTISQYAIAAEVIRLADFIGLPFAYSSKTSAQSFVQSWLADDWNMAVAGGSQLSSPAYNTGHRINLAPFLCYQKIWSEYFRDENVEEDPFVDFEEATSEDVFEWTGDVSAKLNLLVTGGYPLPVAWLFMLRRRAWAHDRFTSSLPFAQRGPDVLLPISGSAPVQYKDGFLLEQGQAQHGYIVYNPPAQTPAEVKSPATFGALSTSQKYTLGSPTESSLPPLSAPAAYDPNGSLFANMDLASLTTTINDFRVAERVQRWFENDARGGVRPNEGTLAHFGIRTPDSTLDRAEFIGGSMQPIVVSEVAQTSESTQSSPQGTLAGKGTSYKSNRGFRMFFSEHGIVFGICSALVRANYWQGIPKIFSRMQRDEYYWPEFANLGEEPVYTKELYADATVVSEDDVFGYVPRYSDLKSAVGEVHGDMRSSLSFWTQTREFSSKPQLNREFLFGDPSLAPFAVQSLYSDPIILTIQFNVRASRLMPFYGVPTL